MSSLRWEGTKQHLGVTHVARSGVRTTPTGVVHGKHELGSATADLCPLLGQSFTVAINGPVSAQAKAGQLQNIPSCHIP